MTHPLDLYKVCRQAFSYVDKRSELISELHRCLEHAICGHFSLSRIADGVLLLTTDDSHHSSHSEGRSYIMNICMPAHEMCSKFAHGPCWVGVDTGKVFSTSR